MFLHLADLAEDEPEHGELEQELDRLVRIHRLKKLQYHVRPWDCRIFPESEDLSVVASGSSGTYIRLRSEPSLYLIRDSCSCGGRGENGCASASLAACHWCVDGAALT